MFKSDQARYATGGVIQKIPGTIIDSIWLIIDYNLSGVFPLGNLLYFFLEDRDGHLSIAYSADGVNPELSIDLPFDYESEFPHVINAIDDGERQTILLPDELKLASGEE